MGRNSRQFATWSFSQFLTNRYDIQVVPWWTLGCIILSRLISLLPILFKKEKKNGGGWRQNLGHVAEAELVEMLLSSSSSPALPSQLSSSLPPQQLPRVSPHALPFPKSISKPSITRAYNLKIRIFHKTLESNCNRTLVVKCHRNFPLVSSEDNWGMWTALLGTGTLGLW